MLSRIGGWWARQSFVIKLPVLFASVLAVAVIAYAYQSYRAVWRSAAEVAEARLRGVAVLLAETIGAGNTQRAALYARSGAVDPIRRALSAGDTAGVSAALKPLLGANETRGVLLINHAGQTVAGSADDTTASASQALAAALAQARHSSGLVVSPLFMNAGVARYWHVVQLRAGAGGFLAQQRRIGTVGGASSSNTMLQQLIGDAVIYVASAGGRSWVKLDGAVVDAGVPAPAGGVFQHERERTGYLAYAAPVPRTPWVIVAETSALVPRHRALVFLFKTAPIAVLIILFGTVAAVYIGHRFADPVRAVAEAAHAFGAGDFSRRVQVRRADELGLLAQSFNRMADDIRGLNEELEARVEARTAELRAVNEELESFSYSVSHDLRSPLRSIDGFSQALLEDYGSNLDDTARDYLRRLRGGAQRMGQLIDDLLLLSRVTRQPLVRGEVDVSALAQDIGQELISHEQARCIELAVAPALRATGDRGLLRIALQNLLGNAVKFTAKRSAARVEVGHKTIDGEDAFYVADNGAGFDMKYAHNLFAPFQRLHSIGEFNGTGIGLATVRRIVQRHGGKVWVEARPGEGATFYFTLNGNHAIAPDDPAG